MISGEVISIRWGGEAVRLDSATNRIERVTLPRSAVPDSVARAADGDFVWTSGADCTRGRIYRWAADGNRVTSVAAKSHIVARPVVLNPRAVMPKGCGYLLDPDRGVLYPLLAALDQSAATSLDIAYGTFQAGPWVASNVSRLSAECCELVRDLRSGEWRKIPPVMTRNHDFTIVGLTSSFVVWEEELPDGAPTGALRYARITDLKKAVGLEGVSRRGESLTFRYSSFATGGRPQVYYYQRGSWLPITHDRLGTGTITFTRLPGRHWYRIYKGGYWTRRTLR